MSKASVAAEPANIKLNVGTFSIESSATTDQTVSREPTSYRSKSTVS